MKLLRRLFRGTFLCATLGAVAYFTFLFVRHRPRCTIAGPYHIEHLSADGSRLVVLKESGVKPPFGPLLTLDTQTGAVDKVLFGERTITRLVMSPDGQHLAVAARDRDLQVIDSLTGEIRQTPETTGAARFDFSPRGTWLHVGADPVPGGMVIAVADNQVQLTVKEALLEFSRDDRWAFTRSPGAITVWDVASGRQVGTLQSEAHTTVISPDGQAVLAWLPSSGTVYTTRLVVGGIDLLPYRGFDLWKLPDCRKRFRMDGRDKAFRSAVFAPDSRRVAVWLDASRPGAKLQMFDTEIGGKRWEAHIREAHGGEFTPDGKLFYLYQGNDDATLTVFDAASGDVLWSRPVRGMPVFVPKTGLLLYKEDRSAPLVWLDPRTGEHRATGPANFTMTFAVPTPDGRHFLLNGWQGQKRELLFWERWLEKWLPGEFGDDKDAVVIMDSTTGRELFRVVNRGAHSRRLSHDGSTLVTVDLHSMTRDAVIRVWDVHPRRAWVWAIGVTAGVWLAGWWLLRRRRARAALNAKLTGDN